MRLQQSHSILLLLPLTLTSADPPYITPSIKSMLRRMNHLMRACRTEEAAALAVKIGAAIKLHNSAELCKVDMLSDPKSLWDRAGKNLGFLEIFFRFLGFLGFNMRSRDDRF
jgi:hypothetical protein